MNWKIIIGLLVTIGMLQIVSADYYYEPMNFEPGQSTNHTFNITLDGFINVSTPDGFTLVSGSLSGSNNLFFILESPNNTSSEPELFTGSIYLNGSWYDEYYLLSVLPSDIVDTKVELGHGDFNYIDYNGDIGVDESLLFNLVRVWPIGYDIIGEPARNIEFNCTYPKIVPRTVDSKYDTTYNDDNITAEGNLIRMEGLSMFRIFVLSQQVTLSEGENYEVVCDTLTYEFPHTKVIADIQDINLTGRSLEPLIINVANGSGEVIYTILNNETYDLKNVELLWVIGEDTFREELTRLNSGEYYQYTLETNETGDIDFKATFIPEWMFNSRSPTVYTQSSFDSYTTTDLLYNINISEYYINHTLDTPSILEGGQLQYTIDILQDGIYFDEYLIEYTFYDDAGNGILVGTQEVTVNGIGEKTIIYEVLDFEISGLEEDFEVIAEVSMKDIVGEWTPIGTESLGLLTISKLTSNAPIPQLLGTSSQNVTILSPTITENNNSITGSVIGFGGRLFDSLGWVLVIFILAVVFIILMLLLSRREKKKEANFKQKLYTQ